MKERRVTMAPKNSKAKEALVKELLSEDKDFCDLFLGSAELRGLPDC
jgi:hypothetical protein